MNALCLLMLPFHTCKLSLMVDHLIGKFGNILISCIWNVSGLNMLIVCSLCVIILIYCGKSYFVFCCSRWEASRWYSPNKLIFWFNFCFFSFLCMDITFFSCKCFANSVLCNLRYVIVSLDRIAKAFLLAFFAMM